MTTSDSNVPGSPSLPPVVYSPTTGQSASLPLSPASPIPAPARPAPPEIVPTEFGSPRAAVARYNAAGISAILTPATKGPRWPGWPKWRDVPLDESDQQDISSAYESRSGGLGVALILGHCARYVVFDFDRERAFEDWIQKLPDNVRNYVQSELPTVISPKGFIGHIYVPVASSDLAEGGWFRETVVEGKSGFVLARYVRSGSDGSEDACVSIELRVPLKHAVMAPGSGYDVHDKFPQRTWRYAPNSKRRIEDLDQLRSVDGPAFTAMIEAASELNDPLAAGVLRNKRAKQVGEHAGAQTSKDLPDGPRHAIESAIKGADGDPKNDRPGDDFNSRASWDEVLEPAGWTKVSDDTWCRPDGTGVSASTKFGPLFVFSTNAWPLGPSEGEGRAYTKFTAFADLYHGGDYSSAARKLSGKGYGAKKKRRAKRKSKVQIDAERVEQERQLEKEAGTQGRPLIKLLPGQLPSSLDKAEAALLEHEEAKGNERDLYIKGCTLVQRVTRSDGRTATALVKVHALRERFGRAASFAKPNKDQVLEPCDFLRDYAQAYLERGQWPFPRLDAIVNTPVLLPSGELVFERGYDQRAHVFVDVVQGEWGSDLIPDHPSREDARLALIRLIEPLKDFPFNQEHDRSVVLAAVLTVLGRNLFEQAPLFAFTATTRGTGKSLLAEVIAIIGLGRNASMMQLNDETEMDKAIHAALLESDQLVCIDNVEGELRGGGLCTVLSQSVYKRRRLGVSATDSPSTTGTTWMATGNNMSVAGDLSRRVVVCQLDANVERPEERVFDRDLLEWTRAHRTELVAAGLTVLRAYLLAGTPSSDPPPKAFGGFEKWSTIVRGCLLWLDQEDPCASRERFVEDDPEREELGRLLENLWRLFPGRRFLSSDVRQRADSDDDLARVLYDYLGPDGLLSTRRIGCLLRKNVGRIVGSLRLVDAGTVGHVKRWRVENAERWEGDGLPAPDDDVFREFGGSDEHSNSPARPFPPDAGGDVS